ncbi:hypothetical protein RHODGE_RHODGE_03324 [Rhodoplanes serenus]|uniref:Uncharacterized protein n=1 Tax=Rhodoplanes serenus TaxID=200615 RepID=A0A3S4FE90_9BRAD|nr:hypothetical protein [Rhodoplanes serenus]VCU10138.1 hypothetical protein RHODGE_RHODGE_03324 [Rhodoplanes serenus]
MARRPIPDPSVRFVRPDGTIDPAWYEYLKDRDRLLLGDLRNVAAAAPTNGQVLIWNATTGLWTPGSN